MDEALRELERAFRASGSLEDHERWLRERVRLAEIAPEEMSDALRPSVIREATQRLDELHRDGRRAMRSILESRRDVRERLLALGLGSLARLAGPPATAIRTLVRELSKQGLEVDPRDIEELAFELGSNRAAAPPRELVGALDRAIERHGLPENAREGIMNMLGNASPAWARKVLPLLSRSSAAVPVADEPWATVLIGDLQAMPAVVAATWREALAHVNRLGGRPASTWLANASTLAGRLDRVALRASLDRWFSFVRPVAAPPAWPISRSSSAFLRGLAWLGASPRDAALVPVLERLALIALAKVPDWGPLSPVAGHAAIEAIGHVGGGEARAALETIRARVEYVTARRVAERALADRCESQG